MCCVLSGWLPLIFTEDCKKIGPRLIHNVLFPSPWQGWWVCAGSGFLWPLISALNHFLPTDFTFETHRAEQTATCANQRARWWYFKQHVNDLSKAFPEHKRSEWERNGYCAEQTIRTILILKGFRHCLSNAIAMVIYDVLSLTFSSSLMLPRVSWGHAPVTGHSSQVSTQVSRDEREQRAVTPAIAITCTLNLSILLWSELVGPPLIQLRHGLSCNTVTPSIILTMITGMFLTLSSLRHCNMQSLLEIVWPKNMPVAGAHLTITNPNKEDYNQFSV